MNRKKKICVITGSRSEYGLLYWVLKGLKDASSHFELQLVVTGSHLSKAHGFTYQQIEEDGFKISAKVDLQLDEDSTLGIAKSMSLGMTLFAELFEKLKPDLILILGDRYELLPVAQNALISKIPIAHLSGGDSTEGAFDDAIRHSLTKMSHLHFVTNTLAAQRVRQIGENPEHIYLVGNPGLDTISRMTFQSRQELEQTLGFQFRKRNFLITFHPVTLCSTTSLDQLNELLEILDAEYKDTGLIFTKPNADPENLKISERIDQFVTSHSNAKAYTSLGQRLYLNVVREVDLVLGNSSSGVLEVPSMKKPSVDIGNRQKGRLAANSVIRCSCEKSAISQAINKALKFDCSQTVNPYGDGNSSEKILKILMQTENFSSLIHKRFFDLPGISLD